MLKVFTRQRVAKFVLKDPNLFKHLIAITFDVDNKVSIKAAWILEWICTHHQLEWILPPLNKVFAKNNNLKV